MADDTKGPDHLSPEEKVEVLRLLKERGAGTKVCDVCKQETLSLGHFVFTLVSLTPEDEHGSQGSMIGGGRINPVVTVNCSNCGYQRMVNLLLLGVRRTPKPEASGNG
jgi:hypothetical protein